LSFFFSSRRRHTRCYRDWSSDVCSSDLSSAAMLESAWRAAVAYLRASRAQAVVAARQADSSIAAELVTLAEAQKAAGVSAAIDVTRARTQLVRAEGLLIVARNERDRGRIVLARTLGIDPGTPWCGSRKCASATCGSRSPRTWTPRSSTCARRRRSS